MANNLFSVFTKPWKTQPLPELAQRVADMGFDGVEYPLREGYQVQPSDGARGIVNLCAALGNYGVKVTSMAAGIDVYAAEGHGEVVGVNEPLLDGCAQAGVPIVRICQSLNKALGFHENMDALRRRYDEILPYCEKYGVTLGVQMHYGAADITCSYDTYLLLKDYDPRYIAAVWDAGHSGLAGESPRYALDCLWRHLCMVNFKAAFWHRTNAGAPAQWDARWVTGKEGMGSWAEAVAYLRARGYTGTVCLPAEYSDEANVQDYARQDLAYLKELFEGRRP
ncbi:MAG: sugar phosphate isomerase/epimerase [Eubacteriales bacterium]|nr:sugar phosphate isomerase/epimerase [Eubacteriales bacterium]